MEKHERHNVSFPPGVWQKALQAALRVSVEEGRRVSVSEYIARLIEQDNQ